MNKIITLVCAALLGLVPVGRSTTTSLVITNDVGTPLNFSLYNVTGNVYTLAGLNLIGTNTHATVSSGGSWSGVLELNTNNGLAVIGSFNVFTNGSLFASQLLAGGIHQIIGYGANATAPSINTNGSAGNTNPPSFAPAAVTMWSGTNATPNGLYTAGLGSLYEQFDLTGTNFVQQWVKHTSAGATGWVVTSSNLVTNNATGLSLGGTWNGAATTISGTVPLAQVTGTPALTNGGTFFGTNVYTGLTLSGPATLTLTTNASGITASVSVNAQTNSALVALSLNNGGTLTNINASANSLSPYNGQTRLMPVTTKATDGLVGNFWSPLYETNSYGTNWSTQLPATVLSNTNGTYQMDMMATTSAKNLRVLIQNSCGEITNTATITYHVVLWDWTGTNAYPVTFNGQSTITLAPNSFAWGDCAGLCLTKGDMVYERIYYSITNGNCYASIPPSQSVYTTYAFVGAWAEGYSYIAGPNYFTNIDTTLIQGQTYSPSAYMPTLGVIYGEAAATNVCIGLLGDSNFTDASAGTAGWGGFAWYPFVDFALGNNWGSQYPHINLAMCNDGLTQWYNGGSDSKSRYRRALLTGVNFFILNYQHNDFYGFGANMPSYTNVFIAACGQLKQQFPGCKVFVDTVTPSTSSTDGYLTTNNQTLNTPRDWTNANAFNFWLRSWTVFPTNNVDGVYDLDLQCEGNTNGAGIWYAFTNNVVTNCMTLNLPGGFDGYGVSIGGSLWAETNGAAAFNPATFHNP